MRQKVRDNHKLIEALRAGGVAVLRTDTLYGIVARADDEKAVERLYEVRRRDTGKSCIILLDTPESACGNSGILTKAMRQHATSQPTSFVIAASDAPTWLLRENHSLAYRIPDDERLQSILRQTGPLIAPSANPQGLPPARTIDEARAYFGDDVDIYIDDGEVPIDQQPSRIIRIHDDGRMEQLR